MSEHLQSAPNEETKARLMKAIRLVDSNWQTLLALDAFSKDPNSMEYLNIALSQARFPANTTASALSTYIRQTPILRSIGQLLTNVDDHLRSAFWRSLLCTSEKQTDAIPLATQTVIHEQIHSVISTLPTSNTIDAYGKKVMFGKEGRRYTSKEKVESYDKNGGWKLHLTVQPEHYEAVDRWLFQNHQGQYKLLSGGSHDEGSDFTIYIGDRDTAEALVKKMTAEIGKMLEDSNGEKYKNEKMFTKQISGRFDVQLAEKGLKLGITYNGFDGVPFDRWALDATGQHITGKQTPDTKKQYAETATKQKQRIEEMLRKEYGAYYAGTTKKQ